MVIYSVTVNIEDESEKDWLEWMKKVHIPQVLDSGLFQDYRLLKVLTRQEDETGQTYNIQYECKSISDFEEYQEKHAMNIQKEHSERYKGKFFAFRTILEKA